MNNTDEVRNSLEAKSLKVCVVGIGRIGLPTALSFAKSGLHTIGVDINENLVRTINSGVFPLKDEPGYEEIFNLYVWHIHLFYFISIFSKLICQH